jgi:hypothetical protein
VHDARVHLGARDDGRDRGREAGESVDERDEDIGNAPRLQLAEHAMPEGSTLARIDPEAEHVFRAGGGDAEREGDGRVAHDAVVTAELDPEGIEQEQRIDALQRPLLPRADFGQHFVGDGADHAGGDFHLVQLLEVPLDLAHAQTTGVEREDVLVEARQAPGVLGDELGLEGAGAVARDGDGDRAIFGQDGFGRRAVAVVGLVGRLGVPGGIAEMGRELAGQDALHQRPLHLPEELVELGGALPPAEQCIEGRRVERRGGWHGRGWGLPSTRHRDLRGPQGNASHTEIRTLPADAQPEHRDESRT